LPGTPACRSARHPATASSGRPRHAPGKRSRRSHARVKRDGQRTTGRADPPGPPSPPMWGNLAEDNPFGPLARISRVAVSALDLLWGERPSMPETGEKPGRYVLISVDAWNYSGRRRLQQLGRACIKCIRGGTSSPRVTEPPPGLAEFRSAQFRHSRKTRSESRRIAVTVPAPART
jgi:hypothetical protein